MLAPISHPSVLAKHGRPKAYFRSETPETNETPKEETEVPKKISRRNLVGLGAGTVLHEIIRTVLCLRGFSPKVWSTYLNKFTPLPKLPPDVIYRVGSTESGEDVFIDTLTFKDNKIKQTLFHYNHGRLSWNRIKMVERGGFDLDIPDKTPIGSVIVDQENARIIFLDGSYRDARTKEHFNADGTLRFPAKT